MPKQYGSGNFRASQKVALMQLISYLKIAERGRMEELLDALEDNDTRGDMKDYTKPHPNAVLLEALILFVDMTSATGKSMSGFATEMLKRFEARRIVNVTRRTGSEPVYVPPKN